MAFERQDFEKIALGLLENPGEILFYHQDIRQLWKTFKKQFKVIRAAGGFVYNEKQEVLWIYRHEKWDLPKGKIDKGESKKEAAVREVKEECGLKQVQLDQFLMKTYHIYRHKENTILKKTFWYQMNASSEEKLMPQVEEGITRIAWFSKVKLDEIFKNTYGNIKLICNFAMQTNKR